jgi:hypothetical protein
MLDCPIANALAVGLVHHDRAVVELGEEAPADTRRRVENAAAVSRMSCWLRPRDMIKRMDNVGIVVDDLKAAIAFFVELGLELEGEMAVEGSWVDRCVGLDGVRSNIAMLRTPDGHGGLELIKFQAPRATTAEPNAPVNTLGIRPSCSPSTTSTMSLPAFEPTAANSSARWCSTRTSTFCATCAAPRASSSRWRRKSAKEEHNRATE